jgi:hypothetical protein
MVKKYNNNILYYLEAFKGSEVLRGLLNKTTAFKLSQNHLDGCFLETSVTHIPSNSNYYTHHIQCSILRHNESVKINICMDSKTGESVCIEDLYCRLAGGLLVALTAEVREIDDQPSKKRVKNNVTKRSWVVTLDSSIVLLFELEGTNVSDEFGLELDSLLILDQLYTESRDCGKKKNYLLRAMYTV